MNYLENFDFIILFFVLGGLASWIRSDLEIPESMSKSLSIYLLLGLGLKGGHEVAYASQLFNFLPALFIGMTSCLIIPLIVFFLSKNRLGVANSSAIGASYGSVSAITFLTAQSILEKKSMATSGYMVALMALMEMPAILVGIFLYQNFTEVNRQNVSRSASLRSVLTTKSVVLLLGGFIIGIMMNRSSWKSIAPLIQDSFKGVLAFFLLELGMIAQRQLREAWNLKWMAIVIAILMPLVFGSIGLLAAFSLGLSMGDQVLVGVLVGSASYIAAPAAIRGSIQTANPGLYLALPLGLTFPMNILIGIQFYIHLSEWLR